MLLFRHAFFDCFIVFGHAEMGFDRVTGHALLRRLYGHAADIEPPRWHNEFFAAELPPAAWRFAIATLY